MKNFIDFVKQLSKACLNKHYEFKVEIDTNSVLSFFLTHKGKKINFTNDFDGTVLENCQKIIFSTSNLEIRTLDLAKKLITNIDKSFLSKEGITLRNIFNKEKQND